MLEFPWNTGRDGDSTAASDCKDPLAATLTVVWTHRSPAPTHCFLSRADAGRTVPPSAYRPPGCRAVKECFSSLRKRTTCLLTNCTKSESPRPVCVRQTAPPPPHAPRGPVPRLHVTLEATQSSGLVLQAEGWRATGRAWPLGAQLSQTGDPGPLAPSLGEQLLSHSSSCT